MLTTFLYDAFQRFSGRLGTAPDGPSASCVQSIDQLAELIIYETSSKFRAIPGSVRRLRGPVTNTLRYVDDLARQVPGAVHCRRSTFTEDPRVNAFFVDHKHLQEVFSQSKEVRDLFDHNPDAAECFALLCMCREERKYLGMALVDDIVRNEVMQTSVSFSDHQIISPGIGEADARCALKCCIVKSLISYIRKQSIEAATQAADLENRHRALSARLKRLELNPSGAGDPIELRRKLEAIEVQMVGQGRRFTSLEDQFDFVIEVLSHPEQVLKGRKCSLFLDRLGVKHEALGAGAAYELPFAEIEMVRQRPRVASLVCFPREELLPKRDFLREASIFLAA